MLERATDRCMKSIQKGLMLKGQSLRTCRLHKNVVSRPCAICVKREQKLEDYKTHLGDVHGKRMFQCERCKYTFGYSEGLRVHTHACKSTRIMIRTFRCTVCPKSYTQPWDLKAHVRAEHSVGKRTFQCLRCHKYFTYYNNLNRHLREFCEQGRDGDEKKRIFFFFFFFFL